MRRKLKQEEFEEHWKEITYQLELEGLKPDAEDKESMRQVLMGEAPLSTLREIKNKG
ncbi:hypothetical protein GCM10011351_31930 [Paraliobacillus quinghaiensis]|uniref:Uncharacterized protein n=1 Tax=Paraliobacillus quinghaiensis TaxID=470815 RepID=A0A917TXX6_9BACI|nr:hypothetical protein [Paraliobacillus quinghaiensis]GGM43552.1 hypothetical protein GCM10011351_31930 [Paraliobacillus quinghaiensis]